MLKFNLAVCVGLIGFCSAASADSYNVSYPADYNVGTYSSYPENRSESFDNRNFYYQRAQDQNLDQQRNVYNRPYSATDSYYDSSRSMRDYQDSDNRNFYYQRTPDIQI